ncbi:hypothetical protein BCR43DRAFT_507368 [Syncephalastrum racemosum]|uniref:Uncharacterized protein n=1 Tax=Syncephalastrum racemosum TaxID=13706 RepID=A0A1X2H6T0_SYNRA|nr:hypothetical protein BCR43DRAFT_507368 [Syncephalastrum racemosum]
MHSQKKTLHHFHTLTTEEKDTPIFINPGYPIRSGSYESDKTNMRFRVVSVLLATLVSSPLSMVTALATREVQEKPFKVDNTAQPQEKPTKPRVITRILWSGDDDGHHHH